MYTITILSWISILSKSFIMFWKVASEFVSLKNITMGLNNPWFVLKATFHSSPSWIHIVVPQADIQFGEVLGVLEFVDEFWNEGWGV